MKKSEFSKGIIFLSSFTALVLAVGGYFLYYSAKVLQDETFDGKTVFKQKGKFGLAREARKKHVVIIKAEYESFKVLDKRNSFAAKKNGTWGIHNGHIFINFDCKEIIGFDKKLKLYLGREGSKDFYYNNQGDKLFERSSEYKKISNGVFSMGDKYVLPHLMEKNKMFDSVKDMRDFVSDEYKNHKFFHYSGNVSYAVKRNGKWGTASTHNLWSPCVNDKLEITFLSNKAYWLAHNSEGIEIVPLFNKGWGVRYDSVKPANLNIGRYFIANKNSKYIIINSNNKAIWEGKADNIYQFKEARGVYLGIVKGSKKGILNVRDRKEFLIEADSIKPIEGLEEKNIWKSSFEYTLNGKKGLLNINGAVFKPELDSLQLIDHQLILFEKNGKKGLVKTGGRILFEPEFDSIIRISSRYKSRYTFQVVRGISKYIILDYPMGLDRKKHTAKIYNIPGIYDTKKIERKFFNRHFGVSVHFPGRQFKIHSTNAVKDFILIAEDKTHSEVEKYLNREIFYGIAKIYQLDGYQKKDMTKFNSAKVKPLTSKFMTAFVNEKIFFKYKNFNIEFEYDKGSTAANPLLKMKLKNIPGTRFFTIDNRHFFTIEPMKLKF